MTCAFEPPRQLRSIRAAVCAVAVTGLTLGLSSCSEAVDTVDKATNETYEVTYEVTCKITYKGKVIKEEKGQGLVTAAGCIAVSPIVE
ncbi:hypothetical protein OG883_02735 [Streptomyces sp. NBC_01142]|uniref:hypothetical protein n=1 Tax=Streptomyces sp. NBC_01142 TaxID=2975865 RepID=UPI00224FA695|nr:hypothetical protein [Streptomyces sp. NBC_01142]MCX4818834.1 hypothetical protein [Streptomyces sp. NBC_01142]